jgi:hypothetical protein
MKTSTFEKGIPKLGRLGACLFALAGALVLGAGACNEAGQGDRCNPLRSSNECGGGLVCAGNPIGQSAAYPIPFCPENYCCPLNADGTLDFAGASSPYCQPGCNGGAAALCAAEGADAEACAVSACLGDASDPTTCVPESDDASSTDAEPGDAIASEASAPSEAGAPEASASEASVEAAAPTPDASSDATDSATTD